MQPNSKIKYIARIKNSIFALMLHRSHYHTQMTKAYENSINEFRSKNNVNGNAQHLVNGKTYRGLSRKKIAFALSSGIFSGSTNGKID